MKKRILLINPPYPMEESPSPPFGLMSLAGYLLEQGFDVRIDDYIVNPYSPERAYASVADFNPDIIGSTGVTMNIKAALRILKDYRDAAHDAPIVMGGPHVSFDADNILKDHPYVDFIVRGEGELTSVELFQNCSDTERYPSIRGISYRIGDAIFHNPARDFIPDINILPYPARHLVQLSKYKAMGLPLNMITSRGCPYECIFCVGAKMVGRRVRYFHIERVVDEFEMLAGMGFKQINIVDDLFTSNAKRCLAICEEIMRRGIRHTWTAFARVDTISRELLQTMKAAGCSMLCFGIESGVQEILDRVKKKTTLEKIEKALTLCREVGVIPMASYIMGLPGESPDTVRQTMSFAKKLCNSYGFHILAPFPGTEVREKAKEYGMTILTDDWDKYDANQSVCESKWISAAEIDRIVGEFNEGIDRLIRSAILKYEKGETLSDDSLNMVRGIKSCDFTLRLIREGYVERFASHNGNGVNREAFVDYLAKESGMSRDFVADEVDRLLSLGCLKGFDGEEHSPVAWA